MDWFDHSVLTERREQLTRFCEATVISVIATLATALLSLWITGKPPTILEFWAVLTSYGSTYLFVVQARQCYLWGFASTVLYAALFYRQELPATAAVQIYLLGALVYGFFRWGPDREALRVRRIERWRTWVMYAGLTILTYAGAVAVSRSLGAPLAGWEAALLPLTILAQWLLDNKRVETWLVWMGVNVLSIYVFWSSGLYLVAAQYVYFLLNAFVGYYLWVVPLIEEEWDAEFDSWWNAGPLGDLNREADQWRNENVDSKTGALRVVK